MRAILLVILGLAVGLFSLGTSSGTQDQLPCTVTLSPGQSIQDAIDRASPSDVICLAAGRWKESLLIEKSLTLRGAGPEETVLDGEGLGEVNGIKIEGKARVVIEALTVQKYYYNGLYVREWAQASLTNSTVSGNGRYGLYVVSSAQVNLTDSTVLGNGESGLRVVSKAWVSLTNSTVSGNRGDGLVAWAGNPRVSLTNSTVSGNRGNGLVVGYKARASLTNSTILGNGDNGLHVNDFAEVTIRRSTVENNEQNGILVGFVSQTTIIDSKIMNNTGWGVAAILKKCGYDQDSFYGKSKYGEGRVVFWGTNVIEGNGKGQVCLPWVTRY